ncbi:MAG: protein-disulfide reductase DsbD family protein [Bacteroidota bacterium]
MLVAFLAGLAALFTPCVFPMIPMTVTFFTGKNHHKKGSVRNSLFYGFSIILIYSIVGFIIAPFMGPEVANDLATGWVPNMIFFIVFVLFALSFFGLFEINLPHKWVNNVDKLGDKGGLIGVFFMALTLVLVSFSCTGPLVGSILVESAGQLSLKPVLGMVAFSSAFAIPFTLFALFPGALSKLPKSGGWLNSVKVVLGFLELALAFKFLSIADQAYHWNILDREVYLAIWIVIFSLLGFYLLGKIKLPGDSDTKTTSVPKLILAIITFTFVTYMIPGMFGAPLKALAGYLPPLTTHDFNLVSIIRDNKQGGGPIDLNAAVCEDPKYANLLHWPHGLKGYFDYDQAINCAKQLDKPVFIDFTGHGCVNCREMEQRVWSDPTILKRLNEDFVLLALYVDDKTELPESEWYESAYDGRVKKSIGKQNADFQITRFNNNAQPFYVVLSPDEKLLSKPTAYDLNINNFAKFLDTSLEEFKNH